MKIPDIDTLGVGNLTFTKVSAHTALEEADHNTGVGVWRYDYALDLVSWSEEEFRIFGVSPDTFQPTFANFLELVHPDDRDAMLTANAEATSGKPMNFEHRIIRPNGEVRYIHQQAQFVIHDELGERAILIGTTQDITARREAARKASVERFVQERLSPRERATLAQIVKGASNREAARALGISPRTAEFHRANILRKLEIGNLAELIGILLGTS